MYWMSWIFLDHSFDHDHICPTSCDDFSWCLFSFHSYCGSYVGHDTVFRIADYNPDMEFRCSSRTSAQPFQASYSSYSMNQRKHSITPAWLTVTARMGCRKCVSLCICVHVNFVHKWNLKITKWKCWKLNMEVLVKKKIIFYCSSWNSCSSFVVNCHCIAAPEKFIVLCYIEPVQQNDRDLVLFLFLCSPACPESHFLCNTGLCVQKTRLCDGLDDCQDESDEVFCCKLFSN